MTHALVVGGTGMLYGAVEALARRFSVVTVVARGRPRLDLLAAHVAASGGHVAPLALDYRDDSRLVSALDGAQAANGPFALAVCWIHAVAPSAPGLVAASIARAARSGTTATVLHVLGSAAADPAGVAGDGRLTPVAGVRYRQAILGFVLEQERSRWLTDAEISAGVIAALDSDDDPYVVGTVRPWSARP